MVRRASITSRRRTPLSNGQEVNTILRMPDRVLLDFSALKSLVGPDSPPEGHRVFHDLVRTGAVEVRFAFSLVPDLARTRASPHGDALFHHLLEEALALGGGQVLAPKYQLHSRIQMEKTTRGYLPDDEYWEDQRTDLERIQKDQEEARRLANPVRAEWDDERERDQESGEESRLAVDAGPRPNSRSLPSLWAMTCLLMQQFFLHGWRTSDLLEADSPEVALYTDAAYCDVLIVESVVEGDPGLYALAKKIALKGIVQRPRWVLTPREFIEVNWRR